MKLFYKAKYKDKAMFFNGTVTEFDEKNTVCNNGKYKNVFTLKTPSGNEVLCVFWGRTSIEKNDFIQGKGRYTDDNGLFIVWSMFKDPNKDPNKKEQNGNV